MAKIDRIVVVHMRRAPKNYRKRWLAFWIPLLVVLGLFAWSIHQMRAMEDIRISKLSADAR